MKQYEYKFDENGTAYLETDLPGLMLTRLPLLNKSTAFTAKERDVYDLWGILPPDIDTLENQVLREYENLQTFDTALNKYIYLRLLQDRNEVLFYKLLDNYLEEMMPIIYTPTVAEAIEQYSQVYRFPRGINISTKNIDRVDAILEHTPYPYVKLIVATDSEGILGIGDQGYGGMAICIGKLSLYTAAAGVDPALTLPIQLDVGTNREDLLNDPMYMGVRHERLKGYAYEEFMDKFVTALKRHHPNVLLQWEDFSRQKAFSVMERYQDKILSFNDDIQGTGAVVVAGLLAAARRNKRSIADETFVVYGAGAGGVGVARQIFAALQNAGLSDEDAKARILMMDPFGLVMSDRPELEDYKKSLAQEPNRLAGWQMATETPTLIEVIQNSKATVLLGLSGEAGAFTAEVVRAVCANTNKPTIFPLSNPTANTEAVPEDIFRWTEGKATVSTGSPFPDVTYDGSNHPISQGNNAFIFPGLGLGLMLSGAQRVTPKMLTVASVALANFISDERLAKGCVYPEIDEIRTASKAIAVAVTKAAVEEGLARVEVGGDVQQFVESRMWQPRYFPIRKSK